MRYGRQRWRLRGRVEVSNKQVWDSEEYIFLPLVTELLSIKVSVAAWDCLWRSWFWRKHLM